MVLAIGLVVDDAIVVLENVYRHIEEGKSAPQAALIGAREIAGPVIAMTLTLAAVYAPIGFLGGVTGTLFREFAFTLAGAVIISGIVAVTLSPMMCSLLLRREMTQGRFARLIDRMFSRLPNAYGRRLDRSLDYRPVTALFVAAIFVALGFMYLHTSKELAPEEDQGVLFARDQGAAIRQSRLHAGLRQRTRQGAVLDPRGRSAVCHQRAGRPEPGHCRRDPEAVGRAQAQRRPDQAGIAEQGRRGRGHAGLCVLAAAAAGVHWRITRTDGLNLDRRRFRAALRADGKAEGGGAEKRAVHGRRQRSRLQPADDPGRYRPQQGQRAWRHDAGDRRHARADARRELRQPLQSGGPLVSGDPAGAADRPAEPGGADAVFRHLGFAASRCRSRTW